MAKSLDAYEYSTWIVDIPMEDVREGDIISEKQSRFGRDKLITYRQNNLIETVSYFKDSLPSDIAEEKYELLKTNDNKTLFKRFNYFNRPQRNSKEHDCLVEKLKNAGFNPK